MSGAGGPGAADELERLLDERAIHRTLLAYCRGVDRLDWPLVRACYLDDAVDGHGPLTVGPDELVAHYAALLPVKYESTIHAISNVTVTFLGEAEAAVESYCLATHRMPAVADARPAADFLLGARYVDRFRKVSASPRDWKIARRVVVVDWARVDPVGSLPDLTGFVLGTRDGTDPSYPNARPG